MSQPPQGLVPPVAMDENLRLAMEQIRKLGEEDIPKVPESLFRTHILPLVAHPAPDGRTDLSDWITLAGNPQRSIDVIDDAGNVLFRVPPLFRSLNTITPRHNGESMDTLLHAAELRTQQHPIAGQVYMRQQLARRVPRLDQDPTLVETWNKILARYHLPPLGNTKDSGSTGNAPPAASIFTGEDDEM